MLTLCIPNVSSTNLQYDGNPSTIHQYITVSSIFCWEPLLQTNQRLSRNCTWLIENKEMAFGVDSFAGQGKSLQPKENEQYFTHVYSSPTLHLFYVIVLCPWFLLSFFILSASTHFSRWAKYLEQLNFGLLCLHLKVLVYMCFILTCSMRHGSSSSSGGVCLPC